LADARPTDAINEWIAGRGTTWRSNSGIVCRALSAHSREHPRELLNRTSGNTPAGIIGIRVNFCAQTWPIFLVLNAFVARVSRRHPAALTPGIKRH